MAEVVFAPALQRHHPCAPQHVHAATVAAALDAAFAAAPPLRSYVVDDQGGLRRHVAVFIDERALCDRRHLSDAVGADSRIYVVQALSGG
jgi:hypothetical protein